MSPSQPHKLTRSRLFLVNLIDHTITRTIPMNIPMIDRKGYDQSPRYHNTFHLPMTSQKLSKKYPIIHHTPPHFYVILCCIPSKRSPQRRSEVPWSLQRGDRNGGTSSKPCLMTPEGKWITGGSYGYGSKSLILQIDGFQLNMTIPVGHLVP